MLGLISNCKQLVFVAQFLLVQNLSLKQKQRVVLLGITSDWVSILAGVLPFTFLSLHQRHSEFKGANTRLFADDTSLAIIVGNPEMAAACLNTDLLFNFHTVHQVGCCYSTRGKQNH